MIDKRDAKIKKAFIKYLERNTDERFFQAITNFTQAPYVGYATSSKGEGFVDLWNVECDDNITWLDKNYCSL